MKIRKILLIIVAGAILLFTIPNAFVFSGVTAQKPHSYPFYSVRVTSSGPVSTAVGTCTEDSALSAAAKNPVAICTLNAGASNGVSIGTTRDPEYFGLNSACPGGAGWYSTFVPFGHTYTTVNGLSMAGFYDYSDTGHIENPTNSGTVAGIYTNGFYYRVQLSTGGCWGTGWTSNGT